MKLPKNPTEAQILAVTGLVIKSIYTRGTVAVQTLDLDSQGRLTGIFLGDGVRFRYTIDNGILSYAPVNPKDLPSEEGISLSEDALDFARLKIAGNTKQEKKCKVGYACGYSCISQNRNCKKALPGQAKNGSEWVKMQREKEGGSEKKDRIQPAGNFYLNTPLRLLPDGFRGIVVRGLLNGDIEAGFKGTYDDKDFYKKHLPSARFDGRSKAWLVKVTKENRMEVFGKLVQAKEDSLNNGTLNLRDIAFDDVPGWARNPIIGYLEQKGVIHPKLTRHDLR